MRPSRSRSFLNMAKIIRLILVSLGLTVASGACAQLGDVIDILKQYQVGFDYASSQDTVALNYKTPIAGNLPPSCTQETGDATSKRCSVTMIGGHSSGFGLVLQRAFRRQGLFYFKPEIGFGVRYLNGQLRASDKSLSGLPLRSASFSLGSAVLKPYIQFGITPDWWPDLLISMGPAIEGAFGRVSINDDHANVAMGTSSVTGIMSVIHGFLQVELVLKRFGDGAFSLFVASEATGNGIGTKFYPRDVDGMSDFRGNFHHNVGGAFMGFGLKLLLDWP